jgi:hypothetical protein
VKHKVYLGNNPMEKVSKEVKGEFVKVDELTLYKISNVDQLPDFFMTIVSHSDHWMYISSNGALSAGRKNRDNALFPYFTVDKIHESRGKTGSKTICLVAKGDKRMLWEPFTEASAHFYKISRNLYKSIYGNKVVFEEINHDLGLRYSYSWSSSEKFGWIKKAELENLEAEDQSVDVLDGMNNIMPYGLNYLFQNEFSNLADAYKKNELLSDSGIGLFMLSSIPVDRAEPSEALKTTSVWSTGLGPEVKYLISESQLDDFKKGLTVESEKDVRAKKGAYFIQSTLSLDAHSQKSWYFAAEINQDARTVADLNHFLKNYKQPKFLLETDVQKGREELVRLVASSDGLQFGHENMNRARHFSNVLYNIMRGGVFVNQYWIDKKDFLLYVQQCNRVLYQEHAEALGKWPDQFSYEALIQFGASTSDSDLERICMEYLPLIFSRRHGDPSRPWNIFSIEIKNEDGSPKLHYQGNWRDIFQNWEALSLSYPSFLEGMIAKFLNASTADGYNPYRITREGVDWEIPSPDDPWAYIGYWGDHQIIYLQKFLEWMEAYFPGKLEELFNREIFVYADVPYRIDRFEKLVEDPKNTISFDQNANDKLLALAGQIGADGKLFRNDEGQLIKAGLMEKVLVSLLTKLSNFIPDAGIWLNTQRPEWNDANNALVGNGVSMVTLYYLRRSLVFWMGLLEKSQCKKVMISEPLEDFMKAISQAMKSFKYALSTSFSEEDRYDMTRMLGEAGGRYRNSVYTKDFSDQKKALDLVEIQALFADSLEYIEQSIKNNRRSDGMYHAYNLVSFGQRSIKIRYLYEMLEGQVAVLSAGFLSVEEGLTLMEALKSSAMFRADQFSYLLYPDRKLPRFEEKNILAKDAVKAIPLLHRLNKEGDQSIVSKDVNGAFHFNGSFRNAAVLEEALNTLEGKGYGEDLQRDKEKILALYEKTFDHQSFTGRSGTFYGYEGLGSIYWHMVSKLLLAVQEYYFKAVREGVDASLINRCREHYYEIKAGIGWYKAPDVYGAFPSDAYSHTPAKQGVKQPGLTGQVKEDIISRFCELGIVVQEGRLAFDPVLFNPDELLQKEADFAFVDLQGKKKSIRLKKGQMAFTFCQVPIVYATAPESVLEVEFTDGRKIKLEGNKLTENISADLFLRKGTLAKIAFQHPFSA